MSSQERDNLSEASPQGGSQARQGTGMAGGLARLGTFMASRKGTFILSVVEAVLAVACGFAPYAAVSFIAGALLGGNADAGYYLAWCAVAAAGYVAKALLMGASTTTAHRATFAVLSEIRRLLADKLARVPLGYVIGTPSGKLKAAFVERVEQMEVPLAHVVPEVTANLLVPLAIIAVLFVLDWRMALASLVTIPVGLLCYAAEMRDYAAKYGAVVAAKNRMGATIVEYIRGIKVIKMFGQVGASYGRFTEAVQANEDVQIDWMRSTLPWTATMMSVWPSVFLGVLPVGVLLVSQGSLEPATFVTCIALALGIAGPLFAAIMFTDDIAKIGTICSEIGRVLDEPDLERPRRRAQLAGTDIELAHVGFSYGGTRVLDDVSLRVETGQTVALVGPSGSGKSTIARLVASQWDVQTGSVRIGGIDVRGIPLEQSAELIAFVSQDNYLFDDTIEANIRMGRPDATCEEVVAAAKAAQCHDFIMALEDGYRSRVGASGGRLSGGEKQRISIARALLKDAPIVILDEATAYADPENEVLVQQAIAELTRGKTLIVIAHRLRTVMGADRIFVVDAGRVAGFGKHDELLESCVLYRQMWAAYTQPFDAA
ncbi:MAG: ABC transporter ATP-binding protein/permease [Olsenella sp.]|nr:ABC transporter ATP-binding protein/permease [Olsenella sp.]MCI1810594.1 ABC transporter ATP-binding protein/permease [Olsenella sp.]MCI1879323.1 ABC transporter ATP-binding protein/permease [Olsenella sp.]